MYILSILMLLASRNYDSAITLGIMTIIYIVALSLIRYNKNK